MPYARPSRPGERRSHKAGSYNAKRADDLATCGCMTVFLLLMLAMATLRFLLCRREAADHTAPLAPPHRKRG